MPTYIYECDKCGVFECFHSIKDKLDKCPNCNNNIQRVVGSRVGCPSIKFNGTGFYVNDTRYLDSEKYK